MGIPKDIDCSGTFHTHPAMAADYTLAQPYQVYTGEDQRMWHDLFHRQIDIVQTRACKEYLSALDQLGIVADQIPSFDQFNRVLEKATGWQVVAVPGLIPGDTFFEHLANRRFPVTYWIRDRKQMDYIQEPDIFHDFFGHVPLLLNPIFADYMQAYGKGGLRAIALGGEHYLTNLGRLYWYTVEFGLIQNDDGLKIYGAGILSSKGESIYALESPAPNRIWFDMKRIMQTDYRIDDYQETYWVIKSFEDLFEQTHQDFEPIYHELEARQQLYTPREILSADRVIHVGTGQRQ